MYPRAVSRSVSLALASVAIACGAQPWSSSSSTTPSSTTERTASREGAPTRAPTPEPTPAEILRRGCPVTYAEALSLVGTLRATPQPEASGIERRRDPEPIVVQPPDSAPEWPEVCEYPEGHCRILRYPSRCVDYVEFRCGVPAEAALDSFQPCDRPDRP